MEELKDRKLELLKSIDEDCDELEKFIESLEEKINTLKSNCQKKKVILSNLLNIVASK